jgi:hypothetical protein
VALILGCMGLRKQESLLTVVPAILLSILPTAMAVLQFVVGPILHWILG